MKKLLQTRIEFPLFIRVFVDKVSGKIRRFFTPPFSVWAAILLAFVFGALSPLHLRFLDYKRFTTAWGYDYAAVPWYPLLFTIVVLALLYWRSEPFQFRPRQKAVVGTILALLLLCESIAISYFGCLSLGHICMGGHLDHHFDEVYSIWVYLSDAGWASGLIIAVLVFARCRSPLGIASATIAGFLISFRFLFGSFGGFYPYF